MESSRNHQPTRRTLRRWILAGLVVGVGLVLPVQAALPAVPGHAAVSVAAPRPAVSAARSPILSLTPRLAELARAIPCASPAPRPRGVLADWDRLRRHLRWMPSARRPGRRPTGARLGARGLPRPQRRAGSFPGAPFRPADLARWRSLHVPIQE